GQAAPPADLRLHQPHASGASPHRAPGGPTDM
ncbi:MAG: hypothetical protein AVDCRST_MAG34-1198, partial [uncultured Nocardioidaceae bacterium]